MMFSGPPMDRRAFLSLVPGGLAAVHGFLQIPSLSRLVRPTPVPAWEHPEPRPGVDGSRVLTAADLSDAPQVVELFDGIREIPHIADGIRCHCGCADLEGYRSLLSCFENAGMARWCEICQGEGELAVRRAGEGQSLAEIRRAIDARFGHGTHRHAHGHSHHSTSHT